MRERRSKVPAAILPLAGPGLLTAARVGSKAATLARLREAGLPVPDGFCVTAAAYRAHLSATGLEEAAARVARADEPTAGRLATAIRLALARTPLSPSLVELLGLAHRRLCTAPDSPVAVRSSAIGEGAGRASFAGQLETMLGVAGHPELTTAVQACWASFWSPRAVRYMRAHRVDPAGTAIAVLVQQQVAARIAGGALSRTAGSRLELTAAWGLGPAVAQGAVVPDRYVLRRCGPVLERLEPGRKGRRLACSSGGGVHWEPVAPDAAAAPCLEEAEAVALARLVLRVERALGTPVEVEWALGDRGFAILQARPLLLPPRPAPDRARPGRLAPAGRITLAGRPAGWGLAAGPARVVEDEAGLARVRPGDVLVTRVPGPALAAVLPRVAAIIAELGGSTSHLAALARERGIPAVLGLCDATRRVPDGAPVVVDGGAGVVHLGVIAG